MVRSFTIPVNQSVWNTYAQSTRVKDALMFQMCRTHIQAIKALVVHILNSASVKTMEASPSESLYWLGVLTLTKPCRDKMNAWWACVFVWMGVCVFVKKNIPFLHISVLTTWNLESFNETSQTDRQSNSQYVAFCSKTLCLHRISTSKQCFNDSSFQPWVPCISILICE